MTCKATKTLKQLQAILSIRKAAIGPETTRKKGNNIHLHRLSTVFKTFPSNVSIFCKHRVMPIKPYYPLIIAAVSCLPEC